MGSDVGPFSYADDDTELKVRALEHGLVIRVEEEMDTVTVILPPAEAARLRDWLTEALAGLRMPEPVGADADGLLFAGPIKPPVGESRTGAEAREWREGYRIGKADAALAAE